MARIRSVKPELFMDEDLGALSGDHGLLFVGLWTQADREGRLEDRQVRLKVALFPYREVNIEQLLADLERVGKIVRYEIDAEKFIAIPGFGKHQRPHPKEPQSIIPEPPSRVKKRRAVEKFSSIPSSPVGREGKGKERIEAGSGSAEKPDLFPETKPDESPKASTPERFARWFEEKRKELMGENYFPAPKQKPKKLKTDLGWLEGQPKDLISEAARLYILERKDKGKACELHWFCVDRLTYLTRARAELQGLAAQ